MSKVKRYNPQTTYTPQFRGILLYLFLIPLLLGVIFALAGLEIKAFVINVLFFLAFLAIAKLSKKGTIQESLYNQAALAQAPKIRYKTIAAIGLGIVTTLCAFICGSQDFFVSIFLGGVAFGGYWLYYGLDPTKDKLPNLGDISAKMVLEVLNEAKEKLSTIRGQIQKINEPTLHTQLKTASTKAYAIIDAIEVSPQRLREARKFLIVYVDGIAKILDAYSKVNPDKIEPQTQAHLVSLAKDLEATFDKELTRLEADHHFDLQVHIEALKEKIKY